MRCNPTPPRRLDPTMFVSSRVSTVRRRHRRPAPNLETLNMWRDADDTQASATGGRENVAGSDSVSLVASSPTSSNGAAESGEEEGERRRG